MEEQDPRYCHLRNSKLDVGGITAAFFYRPDENVILVGFAFCSPWDQFDRGLGRLIAKNRLKANAITIKNIILAENGKLDVATTLVSYITGVVNSLDDLTAKLGVRMYSDDKQPDQSENFRWWLRDLLVSQRRPNCAS